MRLPNSKICGSEEKDKTLMSKVNGEDQVQVKEGLVRKTIEPESVMPQKLRKEGHFNLFT